MRGNPLAAGGLCLDRRRRKDSSLALVLTNPDRTVKEIGDLTVSGFNLSAVPEKKASVAESFENEDPLGLGDLFNLN